MAPSVIMCIEASHAKGMGHLYRSIRLARVLSSQGAACHFVVNPDDTALQLLQAEGVTASVCPVDVPEESGWEPSVLSAIQPDAGHSLWVNDRLDTTAKHAHAVHSAGVKLVSFDDSGEGGHEADALFLTMPCSYGVKTPRHGHRYAGLEFLVLDPILKHFAKQRQHTLDPRILVSMGGSDTFGATIAVTRQLKDLDLPATIVTGPAFAHQQQLQALLDEAPDLFVHKTYVPSLYEEFAAHDALVCAGGMTLFEAGATGLPAFVVATEPHEEANAQYAMEQGFAFWIGKRQGAHVECHLNNVLADRSLDHMSERGLASLDGQGVFRCAKLCLEVMA
jgi:spore coat polysaccharide biosynthesis predicted glycosyltransferase SpsG